MGTMNAYAHPEGDLTPEVNYINATKGIKSWLLTLDHKRIGLMYLVTILIFFIAGGLLALGLRAELFTA